MNADQECFYGLVGVQVCTLRDRGRLVAWTQWNSNGHYFDSDTLDRLVRAYAAGATPIGVVVERLEDCTEELDADCTLPAVGRAGRPNAWMAPQGRRIKIWTQGVTSI